MRVFCDLGPKVCQDVTGHRGCPFAIPVPKAINLVQHQEQVPRIVSQRLQDFVETTIAVLHFVHQDQQHIQVREVPLQDFGMRQFRRIKIGEVEDDHPAQRFLAMDHQRSTEVTRGHFRGDLIVAMDVDDDAIGGRTPIAAARNFAAGQRIDQGRLAHAGPAHESQQECVLQTIFQIADLLPFRVADRTGWHPK